MIDSVRHQALEGLYSFHHSWLLGMLSRKVRNRSDAQDVSSASSRVGPVAVVLIWLGSAAGMWWTFS